MTASGPKTLPLDVALKQAIAHHQAGLLQEAEKLYRAILQAQPNQPIANHNLGVLAGQVGQHAAGLPYLKTALAANPAHGQYALSYGEALLATGQANEALDVIQNAMQRGLNTPAAQALRQKAEAAARGELTTDSSERLDQTLLPQAECNQLAALFSAGRYADLESRTRILVNQYPDSGIAWDMLGVSLQAQGKDALSALQKAAELLPYAAHVHSNLGNALRELGRLDDAVASYRRALEIRPEFAEAHANLGNALRDLGRLHDAVASCRRALLIRPDFAEAHSILGATLQDLGQLDDAVASYRHALNIKPDLAEAHSNLGSALRGLGQLNDAVASCRRALEIKPDYAEAHGNLGNALRDLGRLDDAVVSCRRALEIQPALADVHSILGAALQDLGQLDDAVASYHNALKIKPEFAEAHNNLGNALRALGKLDGAVASYRRALEIKPDFAEAHNNLGNALRDLEQLDDAVASCRRALEIRPDYAEAHSNMGNALRDLGRFDDAVASYRRALEIKPDFAGAHSMLGATLRDLWRFEDAVASCRRALEIKPDYAEAHSNLGNALQDLGRLDDAVTSYHRALKTEPDFAEVHINLGIALHKLGQLDDAIASYRNALAIAPSHSLALSILLFLYAYNSLLDPEDYLTLARQWEQQIAMEIDARETFASRRNAPRSAGRRLRVGYLSGDFWGHAVSYFVNQLFAHHDRNRIELFAYPTQRSRYHLSANIRSRAEHWSPVDLLSDADLRNQIRRDEIDVLVDLSGHTGHNRLGAFARRAAPVQAHYLGFMASTGLSQMDYWIGDEILTPPDTDGHFSEQVWRLPRVWVAYASDKDAPEPQWRPAEDGAVWIGSFNNIGKLTPATLALWARILHALPEGQMLLKTKYLADAGSQRRILDALDSHGIPASRIELQDQTATPSWNLHMAYYHRLDVALDPIGVHGGGTTTCDALWMGVPVATLEGDRMATRMSSSMLDAIGHPEWIARSEQEYIEKVAALARNPEQRRQIRLSLRSQMARSPLCDAKGLAAALEDAYFAMFARWQSQHP